MVQTNSQPKGSNKEPTKRFYTLLPHLHVNCSLKMEFQNLILRSLCDTKNIAKVTVMCN